MFKMMRDSAEHESTHTHVVVYRSDDNGQSWVHSGVMVLSQADADWLHDRYGENPGGES